MPRLGPAVPLAKVTDRWTSVSELSLNFFLDGENLPIRGRKGDEVVDSVDGGGSDGTLPWLPFEGAGGVTFSSFALVAPPVATAAAAASAEVTDAPIAPTVDVEAASFFFSVRQNILGRFLLRCFFFVSVRELHGRRKLPPFSVSVEVWFPLFFFDFPPTTSASLPPPPPPERRLPSFHPECSFCSFSFGFSCRW